MSTAAAADMTYVFLFMRDVTDVSVKLFIRDIQEPPGSICWSASWRNVDLAPHYLANDVMDSQMEFSRSLGFR
jgi:hypothetical protein